MGERDHTLVSVCGGGRRQNGGALADVPRFPDLPGKCIRQLDTHGRASHGFVDRPLEQQDGDVLREGIRAVRGVDRNGSLSAACRADQSQSIDDTIVQ